MKKKSIIKIVILILVGYAVSSAIIKDAESDRPRIQVEELSDSLWQNHLDELFD